MTTLEGAALVSASNARMNLLGRNGDGVQVLVSEVSANFSDLLGVDAVAGRCFSFGEDARDASPVAMLTEGFWRRAYGGVAYVVGESVRVNGVSAEIIAVLPGDVYLPDGADVVTPAKRGASVPEDLAVYIAVARFSQNADIDDVRAEMDTVLKRENQENVRRKDWAIAITPLKRHVFGNTRTVLLLISVAVGAVVLIASSNLMSLLLARAVSATGDIGIRRALGATRARLVLESVLQSVALCLPGGLVGIFLAVSSADILSGLVPDGVRRSGDIVVGWRALAFGLVVTGVMAAIGGIPPAFRAVHGLRAVGTTRKVTTDIGTVRMRATLVMLQVALTVVLLGGASLVVKSFVRLGTLDPGFTADGLLTAKLNLGPKYDSDADRAAFFESVLERLEAQPPIESADVVLLRPLAQPIGWEADFTIEGQDETAFKENPFANLEAISPGYFDTMRIPMVRGRTFTDSDGHPPKGAFPPVIVSENLANRYWPGEDPIGKRLKLGPPARQSPWQTVIGVVGVVRYRHWESHPIDIYVPFPWWNFTWMDIVVRTRGESDAAIAAIRTAVAELDREVTLSEFETFENAISGAVAGPRFTAAVGGTLATISLVLAGTGLYGLLAFSVMQRRREISVRMVVGATPAGILGLVLHQGLRFVVVGLFAGLAISVPVSHFLDSLLYEVSPTDAATYAGVCTFLLVMALAASYLPAREAMRIEPIVSLRHE